MKSRNSKGMCNFPNSIHFEIHFMITFFNLLSCYYFFSFFFKWLDSYSTGTSTTVLCKHVQHIHRVSIVTEREELKQRKISDVFFKQGNSTIQENNNRNDEKFILARRIILWLSRDLLPFSLVESQGFKDFWKSLNTGLPLPTRQNISIGALDDMYESMHTKLIDTLCNNNNGE